LLHHLCKNARGWRDRELLLLSVKGGLLIPLAFERDLMAALPIPDPVPEWHPCHGAKRHSSGYLQVRA
jgi:hypothetical protein